MKPILTANMSTTASRSTPTQKEKPLATLPERQESGMSTGEKSSSGGDDDKRSESSGGYNADYESSESSLSSKQINAIQQREENLKNPMKNDEMKATATNQQQRRHSHGNSSRGGSSKKSTKSQGSNTSLDHTNQQLQALLPQWNGVRISHPMDPRIDLSTVGFTVNSAGPAAAAAAAGASLLAPSASGVNAANPNHCADHYIHLMEAVRPFFGAYTPVANPLAPVAGQPKQQDSSEVNTGSSEGFTAFFTTTNSNNTTTNSNTTNSDSTLDRQPGHHPSNNRAEAEDTEASASSMVALARVKRKHKKRRHREESGSSPSSSSAEQKRRHEGGEPQQPQQQQDNVSNQAEPQQQEQQERHQEARPPANQDSSSSSSSSDEPQFPPVNPNNNNNNDMAPPRPPAPNNDIRADMNAVRPPLPLVSESSNGFSSTSNHGFSSTSNNGASGSGTGSGSNGNSGVSNKGSSGSGSNGSSGSGNEGKGDSNSGGNSNSDENNAKESPDTKMGAVPPTLGLEQPSKLPTLPNTNASVAHHAADDDGSARENRLMDKKRKRMDKRREYEEQVKLDMNSSSSDDQESSKFAPGKPVTLDTALSFTRTARIVIQASPPFLVVHANAAFTRLTGVDSHEVNGRSISNLFSIPPPTARESGARSHQAAAAAGRARAHDESVGMNVERLVISNGFDDYHAINVAAKSSDSGAAAISCRMCVSPVVAQSKPTDSTAVVTDTNQDSHHHKRRKHHHAHHDGHEYAALRQHKPAAALAMTGPAGGLPQNIITHYVIQLEKVSLDGKNGDTTNVSVLNDREMIADVEEALEDTSHSSVPREPVEAVG